MNLKNIAAEGDEEANNLEHRLISGNHTGSDGASPYQLAPGT
jgi:hypothetical protein